jgi:hypothetical protein
LVCDGQVTDGFALWLAHRRGVYRWVGDYVSATRAIGEARLILGAAATVLVSRGPAEDSPESDNSFGMPALRDIDPNCAGSAP